MSRRILVTGTSVAGNTAAWWLGRYGFGVTVVDHGTTRATLSVQQEPDGEQERPADRQKAWLHERLADAGWQAPRVLVGVEGARRR